MTVMAVVGYALVILAAVACAVVLHASSSPGSAPRRHAQIACGADGSCQIVDPGDLRLADNIWADHCYGRWPRFTRLQGRRMMLAPGVMR